MVAFISRTGKTEKMSEYIAEGIRLTGNTVELKKISELKDEKALSGCDGYVFGCPTYHRDITEGMKTFLFIAQKATLADKIGGAFGSYTHSGESAQMIYDTMQHVYKMKMVNLGPLNLKEQIIESNDGMRACQDYGKAIGQMLS